MGVNESKSSPIHRERENLVNNYITATWKERARILHKLMDIDRQLGNL